MGGRGKELFFFSFRFKINVVFVIHAAEAAEQLGKNVKLVERLVEWCEAKDHAGVMGESNRLLSALIRHSKSKVGDAA